MSGIGFQEEMATVIGQLPGLQRRFLLSATDAEEIPQFTGLDKTIKLNFFKSGRAAYPATAFI